MFCYTVAFLRHPNTGKMAQALRALENALKYLDQEGKRKTCYSSMLKLLK